MTNPETTEPPLIDSFGRVHNNLRISVTDRCNIRCFYCMPAEDVKFQPRDQILSFEEIERVVRLLIPAGVNKLRITGGEPLVRRELPVLIQRLAELAGIEDIALTTNAVLLDREAKPLYEAGLRRLNISLDALNAETFREITRRDVFDQVMKGISAAQEAGFRRIKINAVAIRGITEQELVPFANLARETDLEIRFIEYMPLDASRAWEREKVLFAEDIVKIISSEVAPLEPVIEPDSHAPARQYRFTDGNGAIGIIASVSQPFCANCNRFRLTAEGKIRNCLFSLEETDVRDLLRSDASNQEILQVIRESISVKEAGHQINSADFVQPERPMYSIGG